MKQYDVVRFIVGDLDENAYVVSDKISNNAYIIDPGDSAETLETYILTNRLTPLCVLLTHGHSDHWGAAWEISQAFSIPVFLSKNDVFLLRHKEKTIPIGITELFHIPPHTTDLRTLSIYDFPIPIDVIPTPGHTPGSVAYVIGKAVFSGDSLFAGGEIGEWRFHGGNKEELYSSLSRLIRLPLTHILYPGHGESQILDDCAKLLTTRYTDLAH